MLLPPLTPPHIRRFGGTLAAFHGWCQAVPNSVLPNARSIVKNCVDLCVIGSHCKVILTTVSLYLLVGTPKGVLRWGRLRRGGFIYSGHPTQKTGQDKRIKLINCSLLSLVMHLSSVFQWSPIHLVSTPLADCEPTQAHDGRVSCYWDAMTECTSLAFDFNCE